VNNENSSDFIALKNRIAVFDKDGTLWYEKPLDIANELKHTDVKNEFPNHPEWRNKFLGYCNLQLTGVD
jgi:hypothetical protein